MPTEQEFREAFKKDTGNEPTAKDMEEFKQMTDEAQNAESDIPADEDIKQAFKEETGREPTAKELEEFKEMAND